MSMILQLVFIDSGDIEKLLIGDAIDDLLDQNFEARSDHALNLDKNWDAVDFLFYQTDHSSFPRNWLTELGEQIGEDLGYGPARVWSSEVITAITKKTGSIEPAALKAAFDFAMLDHADVYPNSWNRHDDRCRDAALSACSDLQRLLRATANRRNALLVALV